MRRARWILGFTACFFGPLPLLASPPTISTVFVKTDDLGRVQVSVDAPGDAYTTFLFHPEIAVPPIPPTTLLGMVTEEDRRLLVDGVDRPFHLDLYLASMGQAPEASGTSTALRASGLALSRRPTAKSRSALEEIAFQDVLLVWNPSLASRYDEGAYRPFAIGDIICMNNKVVRDLTCTKGGPGSLNGPGFTCTSVKAGVSGASGGVEAETVGELKCAEGYYACGRCSGPVAIQVCKPYAC